MLTTNANSQIVAALLASAGKGTTFTGLVTRKQGVVRGGNTYGNDLVHTVIVTGFKYERLVARSLAALPGIKAEDIVARCAKKGQTITVKDVEDARNELTASFEATLAGENVSTTDNVYEPLVVNGDTVKAGRVYRCVADKSADGVVCKCRKCSGDEKQPVDGTIYVQGLRIWSEVLEAAPNGHWVTKSAPKTIAKDALRHALPVGRYVSYRLEPGQDWILRAGGTAEVEATKKGFVVTDELFTAVSAAA
jgi:hypothetical protein